MGDMPSFLLRGNCVCVCGLFFLCTAVNVNMSMCARTARVPRVCICMCVEHDFAVLKQGFGHSSVLKPRQPAGG